MITALQRDKKSNINFIELDDSESTGCVKVDAYEIFIYILISIICHICHMVMLPLNEKKFFSINPLFEINLNQIIINLLVFRLTGSTTIASAFAISKERSNLQ